MRNVEILAPAGSLEGLKAAINAGCDALYIGGSSFGARAYANNLDIEAMKYAIDYTHVHGKKLYLTVNTLLKNEELKQQLYDYFSTFYQHGIDAAIVQDVGVLHFIHEHFPEVELHASTQMTLTMAQGANELKQYGVTRLVPSRELSLGEIKSIRKDTDLEIESFVHGALCYCYSGQCLMSSMIGGRSGNRGRCAQTCRMPYKVKKDGKVVNSPEASYVLSPKDICTIEIIPELVEAGIDSFKIEGRMKRPEYAAGVTYAYRKYLDYYQTHGKDAFKEFANNKNPEFKKDMDMLKDLYNRGGFSLGYYVAHNGKTMMSMNRPNHSGVLVGEVTKIKGIRASIRLKEDVNPQDVLEFRKDNQGLYEFTLKEGSKAGTVIETNFQKGSGVQVGQEVYRTKNAMVLDQLDKAFCTEELKEEITGVLSAYIGEPLTLSVKYKELEVVTSSDVVEAAKNQPTSYDKIRTGLNKTNETPYRFVELDIQGDDHIFIPNVKINELRRTALEELTKKITDQYRRVLNKETSNDMAKELNTDKETNQRVNKIDGINKDDLEQAVTDQSEINKVELDQSEVNQDEVDTLHTNLVVCIHELYQLDAVLKYPEVKSIYVDMNCVDFSQIHEIGARIHEHRKEFYLVLPHVFRKETHDIFEKNANNLLDTTVDGYIIRNLEEYAFLKKFLILLKDNGQNKELILDYNVYTMNEEAKKFWKEKGIDHYTTSVELNVSEIRELGCSDSDFMVYGRIPVMVSAQCVVKNALSQCERGKNQPLGEYDNEQDNLQLTDRFQKNFVVKNLCKYCYNTIYNSDCLSLLQNIGEILSLQPKNLRLDFTFEKVSEIDEIMNAYISAMAGQSMNSLDQGNNYTKGHFKRGIL